MAGKAKDKPTITVEAFARIVYDEMAKNGFDKIEARDAIAVAGSANAKSKLTEDQYALNETLASILRRVRE
jgi:hypothetical protein